MVALKFFWVKLLIFECRTKVLRFHTVLHVGVEAVSVQYFQVSQGVNNVKYELYGVLLAVNDVFASKASGECLLLISQAWYKFSIH
jgi:hypothetical protein